ncbi:TolC family protein [Asticcacaulis sp.]|uniref:TolC family protein n=1 Tax=Asticcacaulis sp. TaxID=1872648 RepID=UPI0031DF8C59
MTPSPQATAAFTDAPSFDALFDRAVRRHPSVRAAQQAYLAAQFDARLASQYPNVGLSLMAEYSKQADAAKSWLLGGALDLPIDTGGRKAGRLTDATLSTRVARYDLADAIFTVRTNLATSLATLQATDRLRGLCARNVDLKTQALDQATARVQHGEDDASILTVARLDVTNAQNACRDIEVRNATARADLAALLGLPVSELAGLRLPDYNPNLSVLPSETVSMRHERALYARADILKAIADYDRSENAVRVEVAKQYPEVRVAPGYTWERGVSKYPFNLSLVLPPADLNRAGIKAAEARRAAAGATLEAVVATQYAAEQKALSAYSQGLALAQQISVHDLPLAAAQSRRAENLTRLGEGALSDVLTAQIAHSDAQIRGEEAELATTLAHIQLEDAWRQPVSDTEAQTLSSLIKSMEISQ